MPGVDGPCDTRIDCPRRAGLKSLRSRSPRRSRTPSPTHQLTTSGTPGLKILGSWEGGVDFRRSSSQAPLGCDTRIDCSRRAGLKSLRSRSSRRSRTPSPTHQLTTSGTPGVKIVGPWEGGADFQRSSSQAPMSLLDRYASAIEGRLRCWDRVVVAGMLPELVHKDGMHSYMRRHGVEVVDLEEHFKTLNLKTRLRHRASGTWKVVLRETLPQSLELGTVGLQSLGSMEVAPYRHLPTARHRDRSCAGSRSVDRPSASAGRRRPSRVAGRGRVPPPYDDAAPLRGTPCGTHLALRLLGTLDREGRASARQRTTGAA